MQKKYILILIVSIIVSLSIVLIYNSTQNPKITTTISLQYDGVEKGLNPDETRFDFNEIISEDVVKIITSKLNIKYNESLLSLITITPMLPSNIADKIEQKRVAGQNYNYFPNEFRITIVPNEKLGYDKSVSLKMLKLFDDAYEEYFTDRYRYPFIDIDVMLSYFDYGKYDYPELTKIFNAEFDMIFSYLNVLINDDSEFVSSMGYTFEDIKETIKLSKKLDLDQIDSYINAYQLTNDIDKLILKYEYMIKRYELLRNKNESEYNSSEAIITMLEEKKNSVLLPTNSGEIISVTMLDESYDTIFAEATDYKLGASDNDDEIQYLSNELEKLYNGIPETNEIITAKNEVDILVIKLNVKIDKWVDLIESSSLEYFDGKYENSISLIKEAEVNSISFKKNSIGFIIVLVLTMSGIVFFTKRDWEIGK